MPIQIVSLGLSDDSQYRLFSLGKAESTNNIFAYTEVSCGK